jgi:hypothetical protein
MSEVNNAMTSVGLPLVAMGALVTKTVTLSASMIDYQLVHR